MGDFRWNPAAESIEAGASVVIEEGLLQGVRATVLGVVDNVILVAVALADGLTAMEVDASSLRLDSIGLPSAVPIH